MKLVCPGCGQKATRVAAAFGDETAAYCGYCGWNANLAAKKLRSAISTTWFVVILGILLSAFIWYRSGPGAALAIGCAFIAFPLSFELLSYVRLFKVERVRDQFRSAAVTIAPMKPVLGTGITEEATKYQQRPRRPRLKWQGWMYSAGVSALSIVLILLIHLIFKEEAKSLLSGKGIFIFVAFAWYLWLCGSFFANRWRELHLLTEGIFASGVVLIQKDVSRSLPRITYGFRDSLGRQFQTCVTDFSRALFEQMPVSVFYDEREPAHSMALESSLFRLD